MDFSSEAMEARRQWNSIYKQQNSPSNENKIKTFSYKQNYGIYHKQTCSTRNPEESSLEGK